MKRSTNFSYTHKRRNPLVDMALFLQDLGFPKDEIFKIVNEAHLLQKLDLDRPSQLAEIQKKGRENA